MNSCDLYKWIIYSQNASLKEKIESFWPKKLSPITTSNLRIFESNWLDIANQFEILILNISTRYWESIHEDNFIQQLVSVLLALKWILNDWQFFARATSLFFLHLLLITKNWRHFSRWIQLSMDCIARKGIELIVFNFKIILSLHLFIYFCTDTVEFKSLF